MSAYEKGTPEGVLFSRAGAASYFGTIDRNWEIGTIQENEIIWDDSETTMRIRKETRA